MHSVTAIQVPPVPIQPKTFRFHQRSFDFKKPEQRNVKLSWFDSRPWLHYDKAKDLMPTEAKIKMKPASLMGVLHVIEKTKCISFRKHNSLKDHQGSVLKVLSKTCGDIGEIMSKKHAVE